MNTSANVRSKLGWSIEACEALFSFTYVANGHGITMHQGIGSSLRDPHLWKTTCYNTYVKHVSLSNRQYRCECCCPHSFPREADHVIFHVPDSCSLLPSVSLDYAFSMLSIHSPLDVYRSTLSGCWCSRQPDRLASPSAAGKPSPFCKSELDSTWPPLRTPAFSLTPGLHELSGSYTMSFHRPGRGLQPSLKMATLRVVREIQQSLPRSNMPQCFSLHSK